MARKKKAEPPKGPDVPFEAIKGGALLDEVHRCQAIIEHDLKARPECRSHRKLTITLRYKPSDTSDGKIEIDANPRPVLAPGNVSTETAFISNGRLILTDDPDQEDLFDQD